MAQQCPDGTPPPCGARPVPPSPHSIAVLPFGNRSPDTADVYLAEGMTEEVGSHLTQLGRLQVKARGVVAAAWQRNPDPLGAARRLNVAWYVHGTVRHVAPQLLVSVELVRPATGEQVWAKRFARPDGDLFAVQAEVAESVAVMVSGRLSPGERAVLVRRPTRNNEAYRLYLNGRTLVARRTPPEIQAGIEAYTRALRLDDRFAAAWARVSIARSLQVDWGSAEGFSVDSILALAQAAAARALALDSGLSESWLAQGNWALNREEYGLAHDALTRSLRLDSLDADAFHIFGALYLSLTIPDEGVPFYRRALELNPDLRSTWNGLAQMRRVQGRLAEAEVLEDTALSRGPWAFGFYARGWMRFYRGNGVGALADLAEALARRADLGPPFQSGLEVQRSLFPIAAGDSAPARAALTRWLAQADSGRPNYGQLASFNMALGFREEAVTALQRLRSQPEPRPARCSPTSACSASLRTWRALHDPIFAPLRGDPRFQRLWEETRPRVPWLPGYQ
jgi:TolB-like protein/tetratricopeptide (TPR) repeat protein